MIPESLCQCFHIKYRLHSGQTNNPIDPISRMCNPDECHSRFITVLSFTDRRNPPQIHARLARAAVATCVLHAARLERGEWRWTLREGDRQAGGTGNLEGGDEVRRGGGGTGTGLHPNRRALWGIHPMIDSSAVEPFDQLRGFSSLSRLSLSVWRHMTGKSCWGSK
jgi:hypothetical protein